jgi:GxxExxY protein
MKTDNSNEFYFQKESSLIIKACFEVHNVLGAGFLEPVYQEALQNELSLMGIPFEREKRLNVFYKGIRLTKFYIADFVCFDNIILEIKATDGLIDEHIAQVLNYLKATDYKLGILINFGTSRVQIKRVVF